MSSISLSLTIYILSLLSYYPAEKVVIKLPYTVPPSPLHLSSPFSSSPCSLSLSPAWYPPLIRHPVYCATTPLSLFLSPSFMYFSNDNMVAVMYWLAASMSAAQSPVTCTDGYTTKTFITLRSPW